MTEWSTICTYFFLFYFLLFLSSFLKSLPLYIHLFGSVRFPNQISPNSKKSKTTKMEVVIPTQSMDFDFNSSPHSSAPSTPKRFGEFLFSAPASPTRMSELYREFEEFSISIDDGYGNTRSSPSSLPKKASTDQEDDFAFDFSVELERASLSADELFDCGKIRPMEPPPSRRRQTPDSGALKFPKSPLNQGKKIIRSALSPKRNAANETSANARGRDRTPALSSSNSARRTARSLSPLRVSQYPWEEQQQQNNSKQSSLSSSTPGSKSSRKWRLRDFLLFRSASEGRATDKDPFRKYSTSFKKHEDLKNASFRSAESFGPSSSSSRRKGPVSAHELHYNMKRAAAEDLKKKTYLPYKQSIFGRLSFSPAVNAIANGFGSLTRA